MKIFPVAPVILLLVLGGAPASAKQPAVEQGRALAIEACAACHRVTPKQPRPQPVFDADANEYVPAPSFDEIAAKHGNDGAYLRRAITLPAHPMREQAWNKKDLDAVIAYLKSLKKRPKQ